MLNQKIIEQIEEIVKKEPCSINEISQTLKKNWRTIDRYIEKIKEDYGSIKTKTFRGGTRGALKVVYYSSQQEISTTSLQKQLEEEIFSAKTKESFSCFDIFQNIQENKKKITFEKQTNEDRTNLIELNQMLKQTQKQLILFSGNLSWVNLKNKEIDFLKTIEELINKNVKIKVICRVDLAGKENIEKMLSLNFKTGKELIEIHHRNQPIRGMIIDDKALRLKEIVEPTGKINELNKKTFIFYTIKDKECIEWATKIFYKMFNQSIDSEKRLRELNKIF
jgi:hypothetical protein